MGCRGFSPIIISSKTAVYAGKTKHGINLESGPRSPQTTSCFGISFISDSGGVFLLAQQRSLGNGEVSSPERSSSGCPAFSSSFSSFIGLQRKAFPSVGKPNTPELASSLTGPC